MGKIVLSSDDEMEGIPEKEARQVRNRHRKKNKGDGGGGVGGAPAEAAGTCSSSSVVEWARFLPKVVLRVLLVEADDSTRQIIAALLRKCSYRVAAVSDGLKAWEVLKGRPENIDLILTEVELPSISGYALLTLIMEHDTCKNIPVIMMSSQDSISTVYKCMLRGAADFLVKPVRKNELKNLWQHFWRKQASSSAGNEVPDESVAQQKVEATAENKANSNHSSGFIACIQRNRECIEKGSDAQSSCTKPESEAEKMDIEHGHCPPQTTNLQLSNDFNSPNHEECHRQSLNQRHNNEGGGNDLTGMEQANVNVQNSGNNLVLENFSREAIDLIGAFDNYGKGIFGSSASNVSANKYDSLSHLDLSLRRVNPSGPVNQLNEEHRLNHSDASAFYRYIGKQLHPEPRICDQQKNQQPESDNTLSNHIPQKNGKSLPIQVKGIRFENAIRACDFVTPSPGTSNHTESFRGMNQLHPSISPSSSSQQINNLKDQKIDNIIDQTDTKQAQKLEILGDMEDLCPENDQSANNSLRVGDMSHHPINEGSAVKASSEHGNQEGFNVCEGSSHRTLLREAALKKFRLKRKERCFEKKVRYESRKKLAEQRPRVKGQFVRQVPTDDQQRGES